jgi:hypothetical protein
VFIRKKNKETKKQKTKKTKAKQHTKQQRTKQNKQKKMSSGEEEDSMSDRECQTQCRTSFKNCCRRQFEKAPRLVANACAVMQEQSVAVYISGTRSPDGTVNFVAGMPNCIPAPLRGAQLQFLTCTAVSPSSVAAASANTKTTSPQYAVQPCSATPTQTLQLAGPPAVRTTVCVRALLLGGGDCDDENKTPDFCDARTIANFGFTNQLPPGPPTRTVFTEQIFFVQACFELQVFNPNSVKIEKVRVDIDAASKAALAGSRPVFFLKRQKPKEGEKETETEQDDCGPCVGGLPLSTKETQRIDGRQTFELCPGETKFVYMLAVWPVDGHVWPDFHVHGVINLGCGCCRKLLTVTQADPFALKAASIINGGLPNNLILFPEFFTGPGPQPPLPLLCDCSSTDSSSSSSSTDSDSEGRKPKPKPKPKPKQTRQTRPKQKKKQPAATRRTKAEKIVKRREADGSEERPGTQSWSWPQQGTFKSAFGSDGDTTAHTESKFDFAGASVSRRSEAESKNSAVSASWSAGPQTQTQTEEEKEKGGRDSDGFEF